MRTNICTYRLLIIAVVTLLFSTPLFAEEQDSAEIKPNKQATTASAGHDFDANVDKLFKDANSLYIAEKYADAELNYKKILEMGYSSPELYFNLGNTYMRLGKITDAIYYYEKAKKLIPNDNDLNFNLDFANQLIVDKIEAKSELFVFDWFQSLKQMFSSSAWAVFIIIFSWLFFGLLAFYVFFKKRFIRKFSFIGALAVLALLLLSIVLGMRKYNIEASDNTAIIYEQRINVKHSPEESGKDYVILHEGTKVEILDKIGDWLKIRLADGNVGWIKNEAVKLI